LKKCKVSGEQFPEQYKYFLAGDTSVVEKHFSRQFIQA
jgi:hypothetical protein